MKNTSTIFAALFLATTAAFASGVPTAPAQDGSSSNALAPFTPLTPPQPQQLSSAPGVDGETTASSKDMLSNAISASESCIKQYPAVSDSSKMTQVLADRNGCLTAAGSGEPASPSQSPAKSSPQSASDSSSKPSHSSAAPTDKDVPPPAKISRKDKEAAEGESGAGATQNIANAIPFAIAAGLLGTFFGGPLIIAGLAALALVGAVALSADVTKHTGD